MPFIRTYRASDEDAMIHIFNETAAPDLRAGGENVLNLSSHIWCRPYLFLQPEACLVLDDGNGTAVGYLLGVVDTPSFVQRYKDIYIPFLKSKGLEAPGVDEPCTWDENLPCALRKIMHDPEALLHPEVPELMKHYTAHLHIDILDPYQRRGYGRQLIGHFLSVAKQKAAPGVHLLMAAGNEDAKRFYPRVGFSRFPQILDNGASGEEGRDKNTIWFVKTL